jgi:hypothetical protein
MGNDDLGVYFIDDDGPLPPELRALAGARVPGTRECHAYAFVRGESSLNGFDLEFFGTLAPASWSCASPKPHRNSSWSAAPISVRAFRRARPTPGHYGPPSSPALKDAP